MQYGYTLLVGSPFHTLMWVSRTPARTRVISKTLMPVKGSFSIAFLSTSFLVDMYVFHNGDLAARIGLNELCILAHGADRVTALKVNMILATMHDRLQTC